MDFLKRINEMWKEADVSQAAIAEYLNSRGHDIKSYTVSNWMRGKRRPSPDELFDMCDFLGHPEVRAAFYRAKAIDQAADPFDGLNFSGRRHAQEYLRLLSSDPLFMETSTNMPTQTIRLYDTPVSAGKGIDLENDTYEDILRDDTVPEAADFALRISGDSMEKRFADGQIIFVRQQQTAEFGEIAIVSLNNMAYCKVLDHEGLRSLNPKYEIIPVEEYDELLIFGKVVG